MKSTIKESLTLNINDKKGIPLSGATGMFYTDMDKNLDKYCAIDILSLASCQAGVFAVLKVKEINKGKGLSG
ncbi:MAG TPA: hypothetical protein VJA47_05410 [archaeon]|nr:hypothetical protein [archaeon]